MVTEVFYCPTSDLVKACIENIEQRSHSMPVGWSYNGKYSCPCRKRELLK